ncbi:MAG TPA: NUDIX domain-containing protein [Candidatus Dojkabacteria bacterium]|nr:NUDIX domain-containing protein [Candidatus Dojkabacteria bacterium]
MNEKFLNRYIVKYSPDKPVKSVGIGLINLAGMELLLASSKKQSSLIAGNIEHGESILSAVLREWREEVNVIDLKDIGQFNPFTLTNRWLHLPPLLMHKAGKQTTGAVFPVFIYSTPTERTSVKRAITVGEDDEVSFLYWKGLSNDIDPRQINWRNPEYNAAAFAWLQNLTYSFNRLAWYKQIALLSFNSSAKRIEELVSPWVRRLFRREFIQLAEPHYLEV